MLSHPDFSPRDWSQAPIYTSPMREPRAMVLDFDILAQMADQEEANGAFRRTSDGMMAKAPVLIDDLPAAFYRVRATHPDFTPNHNTSEQETLVVMQGALRVVYNTGGREREDPASLAAVASEGDVVELSHEAVSMQAVSLVDSTDCLALALYRGYDDQVRPGFRIASWY